jgi:hypothetical protein
MANTPAKVTISLDPETKQLLKRIATALEDGNKKSKIEITKVYLDPSTASTETESSPT